MDKMSNDFIPINISNIDYNKMFYCLTPRLTVADTMDNEEILEKDEENEENRKSENEYNHISKICNEERKEEYQGENFFTLKAKIN